MGESEVESEVEAEVEPEVGFDSSINTGEGRGHLKGSQNTDWNVGFRLKSRLILPKSSFWAAGRIPCQCAFLRLLSLF